jgi:hypothetical protein
MDVIFADDARQTKPSRKFTGSLIGIGGVYVPGDAVGPLERAIESLCSDLGFPAGEQFKWSPGKKETFMKAKLVSDARLRFFESLPTLAKQHQASAFVVIEDKSANPARKDSNTHEEDATALFLERADWTFRQNRRDGLVIVATPSGGPSEDGNFLSRCLELRATGTEFSILGCIPLGVITVPARQIRLIQLADVITSCVVARVAGESNYSPLVFDLLKPMLRRELGRIGGVGLKIHPDFTYANLYHWLLGDTHFWRGNSGRPLPFKTYPFAEEPGEAAYARRRS